MTTLISFTAKHQSLELKSSMRGPVCPNYDIAEIEGHFNEV